MAFQDERWRSRAFDGKADFLQSLTRGEKICWDNFLFPYWELCGNSAEGIAEKRGFQLAGRYRWSYDTVCDCNLCRSNRRRDKFKRQERQEKAGLESSGHSGSVPVTQGSAGSAAPCLAVCSPVLPTQCVQHLGPEKDVTPALPVYEETLAYPPASSKQTIVKPKDTGKRKKEEESAAAAQEVDQGQKFQLTKSMKTRIRQLEAKKKWKEAAGAV